MNLGQKYFEVYTTWAEKQVKTGQSLVEAVQGIDTFDPSLVWDKTLDAYQTSIQNTLYAGAISAHFYFEDVAGLEYLPEEALNVVDYFKDITGQVSNVQQSLVNTNFDLLRKTDVKGFVIELPQA